MCDVSKKRTYASVLANIALFLLKNILWLIFCLIYVLDSANFRTEEIETYYRVGGTYEVSCISAVLNAIAIACIFVVVFYLFAKKYHPWFVICLLFVDSAWTAFQLYAVSSPGDPFQWMIDLLRIWIQLSFFGCAYVVWFRKNDDAIKRISRNLAILMGSVLFAIHATAIIFSSIKAQTQFADSACIIHLTILFFIAVSLYKAMVRKPTVLRTE